MGCLRDTVISLSVVVVIVTSYPVAALVATGPPSASDLLAADQRSAQCRRADDERLLLHPDGSLPVQLLEPNYKLSDKASSSTKTRGSGGGFGGGDLTPDKRWTKNKALALQQKQRLLDDGLVRINNALSSKACESLRKHVLQEVETTAALYKESCKNDAIDFRLEDHYGIEPGRSCRTDFLLSLLSPPVSAALEELFHAKTGKLRSLYESLVTTDGILYELASVVTSRGSDRQCIHPDVPFQSTAPLFVVFLALQDVTTTMGPTTFLRATHTETANAAFEHKGDEFDSLLQEAHAFEACLQAGDLVVFDARILHCGNANLADIDRALFNFSFRSPLVVGDIGYKGSMRPEYTRQEIKLGDVLTAVDGKKRKTADLPFALYGDGMSS